MHRLILALVVASSFILHPSSFSADRPNILWITTEDIGPNLGCYGDQFAVTPNLDAFAKRSLRFERAWSNAPVCAPARTTIISGMYPPSTGGEHMRSMVPMPTGTKMYAELLREAGYYCTNNSKEDYNLEKTPETWDESSGKAHWKNRKGGQPFFAIFNTTNTHESQIRRPNHTLVHDPAKAPIPAYHPDTPEVRHDWAQYADNITTMDGDFAKRMKEVEDAGLAEDTIVFFYGDHGAGMPRHKRWPYDSGLRVPFIVHFPAKWKHLAPKGYGPDGVSKELISFVDLAPTLLSIIGQEAPPWMQGRAFAGQFAKPDPGFLHGFRGRMDERMDMVRSVTDGRYTYLRHYMPHLPYGQNVAYMFLMPTAQVWKKLAAEGKLNDAQRHFWEPKPSEELYDLQSDPAEVKNLAGSKEHAEVLATMRAAHVRHMERTRDLGFIPEAERLLVAGERSPRDAYASDEAYPFARVFALAQKATDLSFSDAAPFVTALGDPNPIVRYWGALGLHIRKADGVKAGHDALVRALKDECPSVQVAAADALAQFGESSDLPKALDTLIAAADPAKFSNGTATEALNSITNIGDKAASLKEKLAAIKPRKAAGGPGRVAEYPNRLFMYLLGEKAKE
jgi:arylsulfatase A-like enzyme